MSTRHEPESTRELLGAFALGAVDADESERVQALVAADDDARAELDGLRHATALLHSEPGPSDAVWARLEEAMVEGERSGTSTPASLARRRSRRRAVRVGVAVVAAAALIALALWGDGRLTSQSIPAQPASQLRHAADVAAAQPGSRRVELISNDRTIHLDVLVARDGRAFLLGGAVAAAPDRTLALFATTASQTVLVHAVGPTVRVVEFELPGGTLNLVLGETDGPGHPAVEVAHASLASGCPAACAATSPSRSGASSGSGPRVGSPAARRPLPPPIATPSRGSGSLVGGGGLLPPITLPRVPVLPGLPAL